MSAVILILVLLYLAILLGWFVYVVLFRRF